MQLRFCWTTFDVANNLPLNWQQEISAVAVNAEFRDFPRTPVLSREAEEVPHITRGRVHANQVRDGLPWLYDAYRGDFLTLARQVCAERVVAARDCRYGIVLNVQRGQP
jgi:hypothetical protein